MEYHKLTLRIPKELHRHVKAKAAMRDTTITAVVQECLERWVEEKSARPEEEGDLRDK